MSSEAWRYPTRGGTHLTCGCYQPRPHDAYEVLSFWDWDNGRLVEFSGWCACPRHAVELKVSGRLIGSVDPDQAWLDARDAEFDDRWNARMEP